jgi:electron transfer flavoprotein alpha subunit
MCIASAISDDYSKGWPWTQPHLPHWPQPGANPPINPFESLNPPLPAISPEEFQSLKKQVEELRELLEKAKQYDAVHDEPDCESEDKIARAKELGKTFDVDIEGVLTKPVDKSATPNPNESFRVMSGSRGELARFETEALANKFAEYVKAYSGDHDVFVAEVHPVDISALRYAVYVNDNLVAAFVDFEESKQHAVIIKDAAQIFDSTDPEPEVRIVLI